MTKNSDLLCEKLQYLSRSERVVDEGVVSLGCIAEERVARLNLLESGISPLALNAALLSDAGTLLSDAGRRSGTGLTGRFIFVSCAGLANLRSSKVNSLIMSGASNTRLRLPFFDDLTMPASNNLSMARFVAGKDLLIVLDIVLTENIGALGNASIIRASAEPFRTAPSCCLQSSCNSWTISS